MRRCLIIGASGFLGSRMYDLGHEYQVVGTGRNNANHYMIRLDLASREEIGRCLAEVRPDIVIYAAGLTSVDACQLKPHDAEWLNAEVPRYIANAHKGRCVLISTDYVFDGLRGGYGERDIPRPLNQYGASKASGEAAVLAARPENLVLRVSGLFDQDGMKGESFGHTLDPSSVVLCDDNRVSSPVHVKDVKDALRLILEQSDGGVFHAGGPDALSRYEFRQLAALHRGDFQQIKPTLYLHPDQAPLRRPLDTSLTTKRLNALGWNPASVATSFSLSSLGTDSVPEWLPDGVRGVLVDCVGALLAPRNWQPPDTLIDELDARCAGVRDSASIFREAQTLGIRAMGDLEDLITRRYAPNPEVWQWLPFLARRMRLALVNNGPALTFRAWVRKYGLDQFFHVIANSEELGVRKPQAAFFEYVAGELGLLPEHCWLLDDDCANVEGARKLGMLASRTVERWSPAVSSFVPIEPVTCW